MGCGQVEVQQLKIQDKNIEISPDSKALETKNVFRNVNQDLPPRQQQNKLRTVQFEAKAIFSPSQKEDEIEEILIKTIQHNPVSEAESFGEKPENETENKQNKKLKPNTLLQLDSVPDLLNGSQSDLVLDYKTHARHLGLNPEVTSEEVSGVNVHQSDK